MLSSLLSSSLMSLDQETAYLVCTTFYKRQDRPSDEKELAGWIIKVSTYKKMWNHFKNVHVDNIPSWNVTALVGCQIFLYIQGARISVDNACIWWAAHS